MKRLATTLWLLPLLTLLGTPDAAAQAACADDVFNAERDTPTIIDVLANDTELDMPPITLSVAEQPATGSAEVTPGDTTITFTPAAATGGSFAFRYEASDLDSEAVACGVTVLVNDFPVAFDDTFEVRMATPWALSVRTNDTNITDVPLNIEITSPPEHGTTEIVFNPSSGFPFIGYTPDPDYVGPDSLQYRLLDCNSILDIDADNFCTNTRDASNIATVTINIVSIPNAVDDGDPYFPFPYRTIRNQPITIDVLANDLGLEDEPITVRIATDEDGNPQVFNGTAVVNPDNTVTFTPTRGFIGRTETPGEIQIGTVTGEFLQGERVEVLDDQGAVIYFSFISEILPDRLRVRNAGPSPLSVPPVGSTLTGTIFGATTLVGDGYIPPCPLGCATLGGGAGFLYEVIDGDGEDDEFFGSEDDAEGLVLIDVFPSATTDTGSSSLDWEIIALLAAVGAWRRRKRLLSH